MIGNNRHSDRTFVSEHICIRLALFAVRASSRSRSLSCHPSLFLLSFLPSLSAVRRSPFRRIPRLSPACPSIGQSLLCYPRCPFSVSLHVLPSSSLEPRLFPPLRTVSFFVRRGCRPASRYVRPGASSLFNFPLSLARSLQPEPVPVSFSRTGLPPHAPPLGPRAPVSLPPADSLSPNVYISRQVGMQGRTSCPITCAWVYVHGDAGECAARVSFSGIPPGSAYEATSRVRIAGPACARSVCTRGKREKIGGCIGRNCQCAEDGPRAPPRTRPSMYQTSPRTRVPRGLGQWRIFPPFFVVSFRIGRR